MRIQTPTAEEWEAMRADEQFRGHATTGALGFIEAFSEKEEEQHSFAGAFFKETYRRWKLKMGVPPGIDRARAMHIEIDFAIETQRTKNGGSLGESCKSGCSACCRLEVAITRDEAIMLAERVNSGLVIDMNRLETQAQIIPNDNGERNFWSEQPESIRKCVFLSDVGLCRVYKDRPGACRKYFVKSDPANCVDPKGTHVGIGILDAEITMSAGYNLPDSFDSLPRQLLRAIKETV